MVDTFIRRPILASVCSLVLILAGAVAIPTMPIAQYPPLAPPQINVTAFYTGANAQEVETAVTTPLEQAINGVEGMLYMTSSSTNSGVSTITVTFDVTKAVRELKAGKIEFRVDKGGNLHVPVGKASFQEDALLENLKTFLNEVKSVTLSTTMGPGIKIDPAVVGVTKA